MRKIFVTAAAVLFCLMSFAGIIRSSDISLQVFNEAVSVPSPEGFFSTPVHPGISLGLEYPYKKGAIGTFQTFNLGFYNHKYMHNGLFAATETGIRFTAPFGLYADVLAGIGVLHTYYTDKVFILGDDGEYAETTDWGRTHIMPTFSFGFGYDMNRMDFVPARLFARFTFFMEYPYDLEAGIPMLPHTAFSIGCTFNTPITGGGK